MRHRRRYDVIVTATLLVIGIAAILLLSPGCAIFGKRGAATAVPESCDASCRLPCDATVPLWKPINPDAPDAWDTYPEQVTLPLVRKIETCDIARKACVQCLDRLKAAGVTK